MLLKQQIMCSSFIKYPKNISIDGSAIAAFTTDTINVTDNTREIVCGGLVSCFQSNIICSTSNESFCNVLCSGYLSCSEAIIHAVDVASIHLVCSGEESCASLQLLTQSVSVSV
eukprot:38742_1